MDISIAQVVHLHQIDDVSVHQLRRPVHLFDPRIAAVSPDFRRDKHRLPRAAGVDDISDDLLGAVVHG